MYCPTQQPSCSADRSHRPRKMTGLCAQAKSFRRLCVQVCKEYNWIVTNEETWGKCRWLIIRILQVEKSVERLHIASRRGCFFRLLHRAFEFRRLFFYSRIFCLKTVHLYLVLAR